MRIHVHLLWISQTHLYTHTHTLRNTHTRTLTQTQMDVIYSSAPPAAVQRYCRSCAGDKKRRAARKGPLCGVCLNRRHRKVNSGFFSASEPAAASVKSIMANKAQQPPHLHLAEVTASQFLDIWKHFDADGRTLFPC